MNKQHENLNIKSSKQSYKATSTNPAQSSKNTVIPLRQLTTTLTKNELETKDFNQNSSFKGIFLWIRVIFLCCFKN